MADCCTVEEQKKNPPPALECPVSGGRGKKVSLRTLRSLLVRLPFGLPATAYYFCEAPGCDAVYFPLDPAAPLFRSADVRVPVGAKQPEEDDALVCYCFGIARGEIRRAVARGSESELLARIRAEVAASRCACEVRNPSGRCCLGEIAREIRSAPR